MLQDDEQGSSPQYHSRNESKHFNDNKVHFQSGYDKNEYFRDEEED